MTFLGRVAFACAVLLAMAPAQSRAQELSGKPIKLIVGLAAGGATDVMARLVAQKMSESLRTTVFVENRAGGKFIPALRDLTAAQPDGHTLFFISTSSLITQPLHPDYPFDLTTLAPVTEVATGSLILVARNDLGIKSVKALVDHAKKNPGKLSFAVGGGTGSSLYLATALLKSKTGIEINIIPYKGAGPALNDLLGGHVDFYFPGFPAVVPHLKSGALKVIAVSSAKRSQGAPDVPSVAEAPGMAGFDFTLWQGFFAPRGTPKEIVGKLNIEINAILEQPEVKQKLLEAGADVSPMTIDQFAAFAKAESDKYAGIIKESGVKPE